MMSRRFDEQRTIQRHDRHRNDIRSGQRQDYSQSQGREQKLADAV